jgi:hypothetical protein
MVWRFTSPILKEDQRILYECPTGAVLREAPHVYDAITAESYAEAGAIDPASRPKYTQDAIRVISAEKSRLWDIKRSQDKAKSDAAYGAKVLSSGNR